MIGIRAATARPAQGSCPDATRPAARICRGGARRVATTLAAPARGSSPEVPPGAGAVVPLIVRGSPVAPASVIRRPPRRRRHGRQGHRDGRREEKDGKREEREGREGREGREEDGQAGDRTGRRDPASDVTVSNYWWHVGIRRATAGPSAALDCRHAGRDHLHRRATQPGQRRGASGRPGERHGRRPGSAVHGLLRRRAVAGSRPDDRGPPARRRDPRPVRRGRDPAGDRPRCPSRTGPAAGGVLLRRRGRLCRGRVADPGRSAGPPGPPAGRRTRAGGGRRPARRSVGVARRGRGGAHPGRPVGPGHGCAPRRRPPWPRGGHVPAAPGRVPRRGHGGGGGPTAAGRRPRRGRGPGGGAGQRRRGRSGGHHR